MGFLLASVSGKNNRDIATSTIADIPSLRTAAIRDSQLERGQELRRGVGQHKMSDALRGVGSDPFRWRLPTTGRKKQIARSLKHLPGRECHRPISQWNIRWQAHPTLRGLVVISQNLEVRQKVGNLQVPHCVVGTDRSATEIRTCRLAFPCRR